MPVIMAPPPGIGHAYIERVFAFFETGKGFEVFFHKDTLLTNMNKDDKI